jgi:hypothetical protein
MWLPTPRNASGRRPARRALTLAEVLVSTAAASVLMGGMATSIYFASHALPEDGSVLEDTVLAGDILEQIAADLLCATSVTNLSGRGIEIVVPDRDNDSTPDIIRYIWSGTAGDPIYRRYNGLTDTVMLDNVEEFRLRYDTATVETTGDPTEQESGEVELASHDASFNLYYAPIHEDYWIGQHFKPTLPADALGYTVTRFVSYARQQGADSGIFRAQLREAAADQRPTNVILDERVVNETALPVSSMWFSCSFNNPPRLNPDEGVVFVVQHEANGDSAAVIFHDANPGNADYARVRTMTQGAVWEKFNDQCLLFYAYGTVITEGLPETKTTHYLTGVRVRIGVGAESTQYLETGIHLLNRPEIS